MLFKFFDHASRLQKFLLAILLLLNCFLLITYFKWGPTLSSDTIKYFELANVINKGGYPYSPNYSPGYSFVAAVVSSVLGISLAQVGFVIALGLYLLSIALVFDIFNNLDLFAKNRLLTATVTLLLINSWWSVRVLLNAHADGLLYLLHLVVIAFLIRFIRRESILSFIVACLVAAMAIWVKKNAIVYLPFLAMVPLLFYGLNRKVLLGLVPVCLVGGSYLLFKEINGTILAGLERSGYRITLWGEEYHRDALLTNLADTGNTIVSALATDKIAGTLPTGLLILVTIFVLVLLVLFIIRNVGSKRTETILFAFPVLYILGLGLLFQSSGMTQMNPRTLFPAVVLLLLGAICYFSDNKARVGYLLLAVFVVMQPLRTFAGTLQWYKRAPMDSFVLAQNFLEKDSLKRLDELTKEKKLTPQKVFTNNQRYLAIHFNYQFPIGIASGTVFKKGKKSAVDKEDVVSEIEKMCEALDSGRALAIIFDDSLKRYDCISKKSGLTVEKIGDDIIVYK